VASLLYQVRVSDPLVMVVVVALVGGVGLMASVTAARRGLRLNPAAALRDE
jgi:ABC-type antimicrobial peptide transport system permease subunit